MRVLAIVGSPRVKGNTNYLVDRTLEAVSEAGIDTEKIILSQYEVNSCKGHDACASYDFCTQKDDAGWILDNFRTADGVILASPVYYYNVSAQMKAFLDRNYWIYKHNQEYQARTVGIVVVAEQMGIEDTLYSLRQFTEDFNVSDDGIFTATGYAHEIGDAAKNSTLIEEARQLGRQMAQYLKV
ncbi:MAG: flavodoxin family protein [Dehalococcoidales bacterium]